MQQEILYQFGATIEWHSDIVPENWLLCNGQAVSRTDYPELFNVLGVKYGEGDGSTTFNLPDVQGKVAVGKDENDSDFNEIGKVGGEKEHTLTIAEMPSHSHPISAELYALKPQGGTQEFGPGGATSTKIGVNNAGGGQPHNILQPYVVCNFIIKAKQSSGLVATVVDNLNSTSETDALSAKQGSVLRENIEKQEEKLIWKKQTINLKNNEIVTIPKIKEAQEIYIKASYNDDISNYAIMNILNDGVNGYYNMEAYYWQGAYPISVSINWANGTIKNCSDKSNIVLVAYR